MTLRPVPEPTATYDCHAEPDCEAPALSNRGPYAYLCETHKREKKERASSSRLQPTPQPAASGAKSGYEAKAKELVAAGRRLDRAFEKVKAPQAELREAHQAWKQLLERLAGSAPGAAGG